MERDPLFDVGGLSVLVAGGAGGLGAVLAEAFAERGAKVLVADLGTRLAEHDATRFASHPLDVTDARSCEQVIEAAEQRFSRLDVLVNATGVYRTAPALGLSLTDWKMTIDVNLTGAFLLAQAAGRVMAPRRSGRIITLASVSSAVSNPEYAAYAASKAGVAHLTRVLAVEWAAHGVTVNAIGPAMTETAMTAPVFNDPARKQAALARIPAGRFARPDDIVGTALFLAAPAGAFITGQVLYVDGGRTVS